MNICDLKINQRAIITEIEGNFSFTKRLKNLGVNIGDVVTLKRIAPLGNPIEIEVNGFILAIRINSAKKIKVSFYE